MTHGRGTVYPIRNHPKLRERVSSRYGNVTPQQPTLTKKKTFSITLLGTGQTSSLLLLHHLYYISTPLPLLLPPPQVYRTDCSSPSSLCLYRPHFLPPYHLILTKQRLLYYTSSSYRPYSSFLLIPYPSLCTLIIYIQFSF